RRGVPARKGSRPRGTQCPAGHPEAQRRARRRPPLAAGRPVGAPGQRVVPAGSPASEPRMTAPLTAFLLRSHGGHAWQATGTPIEWRPDHVLLDDADGTVAALAFDATGSARVACELVLIAPQRESSSPDGLADLRFLQSFAGAAGAQFARPGAGSAGALHRRRFAAPGRVLASAVPGRSAAGAPGV